MFVLVLRCEGKGVRQGPSQLPAAVRQCLYGAGSLVPVCRFWAIDVTKPYECIGFGAMDVTKPYEFISLGAMDVTKPLNLMGLGPWVLGCSLA